MNPNAPTRRWFVPTPSWLVFCLLASTGVLYVSQRFQWFEFNHHKGWAVLIAVACVGVFFVVAVVWLAAAVLFRLRFQNSVRSLLLLTLAAALPFSWLATEMRKAREQRALLDEMKADIRYLVYDWEQVPLSGSGARPTRPPGPKWLQDLLGVDFFTGVVRLDFNSPKFTDARLEQITGLTELQSLNLVDTEITDAGLEHLRGFTRLRDLGLGRTKITDAGLERLKFLTQLGELYLCNTKITDAGLEHLKGLKHLFGLDVSNTKVTDAGLEHLKDMTPLLWLVVSDTKVTDAGLEHLKGLKQLLSLYLQNTKVTDAGLEHLKGLTRLQVLLLTNSKVTDAGLEHLKGLSQLKNLNLYGTAVTDVGEADLQRKLPGCKIDRPSMFRGGWN